MAELRGMQHYHGGANALEHVAGVIGTDVLRNDPRFRHPVTELTMSPGYDRIPPRVLRTLCEWDLGIRTVQPRGEPTHRVAVIL